MAVRIGRRPNSEQRPLAIRQSYKSPFWTSWVGLRRRCTYKNHINYSRYGGRGITYTARWDDYENFYNDMYETWKPGLVLDRIDNDGNYEKSNCRWVTQAENSRNKSVTKRYEYNGKSLILADWSKVTGIKRSTLAQRLYVYKWPLSKALESKTS